MKRTIAPVASALLLTALTATTAQAADKSPGQKAVEYRQGLLTVLGGNFGPLFAMSEGKMPYDAAEAAKRGERVAFLAKMLGEAFPPDSKPDSPGVSHTDAKPEIWTKSTEFQKDLQNLVDRTQALATAAQSGDAAKLKSAVGDAGKACKDCHDEFRVKH